MYRARGRGGDTCTIGVDIGGTFTDIVALEARTSRVMAAKVLTDYQDLARGVITGIQSILEQNRISPRQIARVVHGTTLVTNSLIERRGAQTALIATRGFADVLEMGRESRYDIFDIDIEMPVPLVPRASVFEVRERMSFQGAVLEPLAERDVADIAARLEADSVASVAVCLLHAYANPAHERRIAELLAARLPGVSVSLSCDVMPDLREYERASTTAANAYVKPVVKRYLDRLAIALQDLGVQCPLSIMTSDGGVIDAGTAAEFPVRLTESGPAGGAIAAACLGAAAGQADLIAYDMGGTTAKICVIGAGQPLKANSFECARVYRFARGSGLPLQIPVIEMMEIGAGGGSIAQVNAIGMLQIGPESANAAPGPACYGLGGMRPTVTDADLVLGYIAAESFLGGDMRLDVERARAAISTQVAKPLRMTIADAAYAIHRVVNANMARAAKVHCLEHGNDPRRFTLFAYGGAGPVHAYGVAQLLGVRELLYPLRAGVMSALGFLVAKPSFEVLRGSFGTLLDCDLEAINGMLADMVREATRVVRNSAPDATRLAVLREVAVRYPGQSHELYVPFATGMLDARELKRIAANFAAAYAARYHALAEHDRLEAVRWRVRVTAVDTGDTLDLAMPKRGTQAAIKGRRAVYVAEKKGFVQCPVYDRYALPVGATFAGPAVVEERESTVYLGAQAHARLTACGDLRVTLGTPAPNKQLAARHKSRRSGSRHAKTPA